MKKFIFLILVLVSTCTVYCLLNGIGFSNNEVSNNEISETGKDGVNRNMCSHLLTVYSKDRVPFDIVQIVFDSPSHEKTAIFFAIASAFSREIYNYNSDDILSGKVSSDIWDNIYYDLRNVFAENPSVSTRLIEIKYISIVEQYSRVNKPRTVTFLH